MTREDGVEWIETSGLFQVINGIGHPRAQSRDEGSDNADASNAAPAPGECRRIYGRSLQKNDENSRVSTDCWRL
jgi:hypothetical protein